MSFAGKPFTKDTWFERPKQVAVMDVFDEWDVDTFIGLAYHDEVVCLCCGTVFSTAELEEDNAVYKILDWVNCDRYIKDYKKPFDEADNSNS